MRSSLGLLIQGDRPRTGTRMRVFSLAAGLLLSLPHAAAAQPLAQMWAWCRGENPVLLLRGCDALIRSGRETPANLARAYFNRGRYWNDLGRYDRAVRDFDQAIRRDAEYPEAYESRGIAHKGLGQYEQALLDFGEAIRLDPNYAIAFYNRALTHQLLGRADEAAADFAHAREAGPRLTEPKE